MRRFFFSCNSNFFLSSLHLNAPNHYYSIRFFFWSLFYFMCFNLYIKNVNVRGSSKGWNEIWSMAKGQIWRQCYMNLVEHGFHALAHTHLSIPGPLWEHFFHRNHSSRLKYRTRSYFTTLTTSVVYCDHIEKSEPKDVIHHTLSVLSVLKILFVSFVFVKKRMEFMRKNMINWRMAKCLWRLRLSSIDMNVCVSNKIDLYRPLSIYNIYFIVRYFGCIQNDDRRFVAPKSWMIYREREDPRILLMNSKYSDSNGPNAECMSWFDPVVTKSSQKLSFHYLFSINSYRVLNFRSELVPLFHDVENAT